MSHDATQWQTSLSRWVSHRKIYFTLKKYLHWEICDGIEGSEC